MSALVTQADYTPEHDTHAATSVTNSGSAFTDEQYRDLLLKYEMARRRIVHLEAELASLRQHTDGAPATLKQGSDSPLDESPPPNEEDQQATEWKKQLVNTLENQRCEMLRMETENKLQIIMLTDEVKRVKKTCEELKRENESLKERVASDVLRQCQAKREAVALRRARMSRQVRTAGQCRLEYLEGVLMEAHDDNHFRRRFDSAEIPTRKVTFVIHLVANVSYPLKGTESFTMDVYNQLLQNLAERHKACHVCFDKNFHIFAFYCATSALRFAELSHTSVLNVQWPEDTKSVPFFAPVVDCGDLMFSGPRIHTCMYTCNPGSEVDPITGSWLYYGKELRDALLATAEKVPVGEIVANRDWCTMFLTEHNIVNDVNTRDHVSLQAVRDKLGSQWSVTTADPASPDLFCSLLPTRLARRRGLPPYMIDPVLRLACDTVNVEELVPSTVGTLKGLGPVNPTVKSVFREQQCTAIGGWANYISHMSTNKEQQKCMSLGAEALTLFIMKQERDLARRGLKKTEEICAYYERMAMESEDRYANRFQIFGQDQVAFVCTVDIGEIAGWQQLTEGKMSLSEQYDLRDRLHETVLAHGKKNDGMYVNGNGHDVLTFAFQQSCQALSFAAQVYASVSKPCNSFKERSMCLVRVGIAVGNMQLIKQGSRRTSKDCDSGDLRHTHRSREVDGNMKLRGGAAVIQSANLCDIAKGGEIIASAEVIADFHSKRENVITDIYNIVRYGSRFLDNGSTLTELFSVLPKDYAYVRKYQMGDHIKSTCPKDVRIWCPQRSAKKELTLRSSFVTCTEAHDMLREMQGFIERNEASIMSAHDMLSTLTAKQAIRLPWMVPRATKGVPREMKERGFLFCGAVGLGAISRGLPSGLYAEVCEQYNYVVQEVILNNDGFIALTDSFASYIVMFDDASRAMEAALQIQSKLLQVPWPREIMSLAPSLRVQSAHDRTLLFNGARATTVVHSSRNYESCRSQSPQDDESGMWLGGRAIEELMGIVSKARNGDAILTLPAHKIIESTNHGRLLLQQVEMEILCDSDNGAAIALSFAARRLKERLKYLNGERCSPSLGPRGRRLRASRMSGRNSAISPEELWWMSKNTASALLPAAQPAPWGTLPTRLSNSLQNVVSACTEQMINSLGRERSSALYTNPFKEHILAITSDMLFAVNAAFSSVAQGEKDMASQSRSSSLLICYTPTMISSLDLTLIQSTELEQGNRSSYRKDRGKAAQNTLGQNFEETHKHALTMLNETFIQSAKAACRALGYDLTWNTTLLRAADADSSGRRRKRKLPPLVKRGT
uniref:WGS project CAEQ00000000 data, annotated contig 235 n=1 Tax=Trypanosoma congolense (strain IL3000) TaxID=1068625 RepID=F9WDC6_TRYCI|nr:unnamed protein product [Trypanosoma congolense IL3000]